MRHRKRKGGTPFEIPPDAIRISKACFGNRPQHRLAESFKNRKRSLRSSHHPVFALVVRASLCRSQAASPLLLKAIV